MLVGDSGNDSDFEGFTRKEIVMGEEFDVDKDLVVAQYHLDLDNFEDLSVSFVS